MSAAEKTGSPLKEYEYIVSKKTKETVKRVCVKDADDVLKKLREGKIVGRGVHTFRAQKNRITRRVAKAKNAEGAEDAVNPDAKKTAAPPEGGGQSHKSGKDK